MAGGYPCCCGEIGSSGSSGSSQVECLCCDGFVAATRYQVDVSGILDGLSCTTCENADGSYIVDWQPWVSPAFCPLGGPAPFPCQWFLEMASSTCDEPILAILRVTCTGVDSFMDFRLYGPCHVSGPLVGRPSYGITWLKSVASPSVNCLVSGLVLPFYSAFGAPFDSCTADAASQAVVYAL